MSDFQAACKMAIEMLHNPPPVDSKLAALDALDRLALNPSGWFPNRVLKQLTDARVAIITGRWRDALVTLEQTYTAAESFIGTLEEAEHKDETERQDALTRARDELSQCGAVQAYVGKRSTEPED